MDAATRLAVNSTPGQADALRKEQNAEADRAEQAGARSNRVTLAIVLAALAASLSALAAAAGQRRYSVLDLAAVAVLGLSFAAVVSVPLV